MLRKRIITAFVLLPAVGGAIFYLPPALWAILTAIIVEILLWEFACMTPMSSGMRRWYLILSSLLLAIAWVSHYQLGVVEHIFVLVFWLLLVPLWLLKRWSLCTNSVGWLIGWIIMLPAWMAFQQCRPSPKQGYLLLMLMGIVWVADTTAYIAGKCYGYHKLSETISPGKTWEGVVGGLIGALLYVLVLYTSKCLPPLPLVLWLIVTLVLAFTSMVGDLLESWFKRCAGIKDSSFLLPGHGGFYDRMDGLVAVMASGASLFAIFYDSVATITS